MYNIFIAKLLIYILKRLLHRAEKVLEAFHIMADLAPLAGVKEMAGCTPRGLLIVNCFLFAIVIIKGVVDFEVDTVEIKDLFPPSSSFVDLQKATFVGCNRAYQLVADLLKIAFGNRIIMIRIIHVGQKVMEILVSQLLWVSSATKQHIVDVWMDDDPRYGENVVLLP
jgi:hypothetical protein